MKNVLLLILMFCMAQSISAQTYIKDTTILNKTYKMYQGTRGGRYIEVLSKTGNTYRRYFSPKRKP